MNHYTAHSIERTPPKRSAATSKGERSEPLKARSASNPERSEPLKARSASNRERSEPLKARSASNPERSEPPKARSASNPNRNAFLTLVGAGPGDPDLITRKGLKALQSADVVLYDALSSDELLTETPPHCQHIFVGKRAGCHYKKQEEINEMIVACAREYGHVVRLKGGDPFVFGRGQEESAYAAAHGIPVTVVPGISSCISLPALQGVPPTSRGYADSFWVVTAHTRSGGLSEDLFLAAKSAATVVILMGLGRLDQICALYAAEGRGELPAMVIQNGSRPDERCWVGTVDDIAPRVAAERDAGPGIIVLGEVVRLHQRFPTASTMAQLADLLPQELSAQLA